MNTSIEKKLQAALFEIQDLDYKAFHERIVPNINPDNIIGIRTPNMKKFAKEWIKTEDPKEVATFLNSLPHQYYEENFVHAYTIMTNKNYTEVIHQLDSFLPYIDNWATCDQLRPNVFKKHLDELVPEIERWIEDSHPYTIRFGIEMLMSFYLDDAFDPIYLKKVSTIRSEEYYVNMMIAWYFATALAKQWEATIPYLETPTLDKWSHNKAIQKARESYRITPEQKEYLKKLKL